LSPWLLFAGRAQSAADGIRPYWVLSEPLREAPGMLWRFVHRALLPYPTGLGPAVDAALTLALGGLVVVGACGIGRSQQRQRRLLALAGLQLGGAVVAYAAAYLALGLHHALWPRYALPLLPLVWLCTGSAVDALATRAVPAIRWRAARYALRPAVMLAVVALGATQFAALPRATQLDRDRHLDYRAVTGALRDKIGPDDVLVHAPPYGALLAFHYHWSSANPVLVGPLPESFDLLAREPRPRRVWILAGWQQEQVDVLANQACQRAGYRLAGRVDAAGLTAVRLDRVPQ